MNIVFFTPYPKGTAPSQRFRYEQYLRLFEDKKMAYESFSFLDQASWSLLYKEGYTFLKALGLLKGYANRIAHLFHLRNTDFVFIHREATPLGPPIFEWIIAKILRKKIIYDFDDAIWIPNTSRQNKWVAWLKWHGKVKWICRWSYKVSCGNEYLADYARQFNDHVVVMPTVVDTEHQHKPSKERQVRDKIVIGWTGSHSTLKYLHTLIPIIENLEGKYDFEFVVIADKNPNYSLKSFRFVPWNKETEIEDLQQLDIGLMPLQNTDWAKGKCGFKAIQYGAMEIPSIVSPVGVNAAIVQHGITGYHAKNPEEWTRYLEILLQDSNSRQEMGRRGRKRIQEHYSVEATKDQFFQLFT